MSTEQIGPTELADGQRSTVEAQLPWRFRRTSDGRPRSLAWVFYAILSGLGALALLSHPTEPGLWVLVALLALYTRYLYRGGRWVVFFWVW